MGGPELTAAAQAGALVQVLEAIDLSLQNIARDITDSQSLLGSSFGQIAARFAQVHSIAVAGESGSPETPGETLSALRRVVDALTVELQFEDSLNQLFMHALTRIESMCVALGQTRALAAGGNGEERGEHALEVLARTLESLRNAEHCGVNRRFDGRSGSVDMF